MLTTRANGLVAAEGDLKAWVIPQIPGEPFEVDVETVAEGRAMVRALADFQLFMLKHRVMPDYSNVCGVVRFESGEWSDVEDDEEYEPSEPAVALEVHGQDNFTFKVNRPCEITVSLQPDGSIVYDELFILAEVVRKGEDIGCYNGSLGDANISWQYKDGDEDRVA